MKRKIFTFLAVAAVSICFLPSCKDDTDQFENAFSTYDIHGYIMDAEELPVQNAMIVLGYNKDKGSDPVMELISDTTYTDNTGWFRIERDAGIPITGDFTLQVTTANKAGKRMTVKEDISIGKTDYDMERGSGRYGLAEKNILIELK